MAWGKKRFIKTWQEGSQLGDGSKQVWVDTETGVNYLYINSGYSGGLTPLLDRDGKPIITTVNTEY